MALTPAEDKQAVWERIRHDPWMEKSFNLVGKTDAEAATIIRKNRIVADTELKGDVRFCLIYDIPSIEVLGGAGELYELSGIEVDMLAPLAAQDWCDKKLSQIIGLCGKGWSVNGREVYRVNRTGDLTAAAGFYRCGVRIYYHSCTETEIQKI